MITVLAKINISSAGENAITEAAINQDGLAFANNISNIVNNSVSGKNPFILGTSALGSGAVFTKYGVDLGYYIGQKCDENGEFSADNILSFKVENGVEAITVEFAKEINEYAVSIHLLDMSNPQTPLKSWVNDDPIFTVKYSFEAGKQYGFLFETWSKPNSRLVLQGLYSKSEFVFDRRSIISTDTKIADRNSFDEPSFGIFSNSGTLELRDLDGEIYDAVRDGIIVNGAEVSIVVYDTYTKKQSPVAYMIISSCDYDTDNRTLSISLTDRLESLSEYNYRVTVNPKNLIEYKKTFFDIATELLDLAVGYTKSKGYIIDLITKLRLKSKSVYYYLEEGSVWQQLTKLCVACQLHIYTSEEGYIVCKYNGGD